MAKYVVLLEKRAVKQFQSLGANVKPRMAEALKALEEGFSARLDIKKLRGLSNSYRVRVGDYRLLFELTSDREIRVFAILHRERAYE